MNEKRPWHDQDAFWQTFAPFMFGEERWAGTPAEIDQLLDLFDLTPGAPILDLCCGPGRHSLELASRGYRVTGVDRTTVFLTMARQKAAKQGLDVEFVQDDMRRFSRPETFDAALSMFTSFGYFEDPAENRQVLENVYGSLRDGGTLVMEMMGKEVLARIFRERDWREEDGIIYLEERQISRDWSWVENRWIMLRDGTRHEFKVTHWLYSAAELASMLRESGFGSVEIYGSLEGDRYDHTAKRLVAVAQKTMA